MLESFSAYLGLFGLRWERVTRLEKKRNLPRKEEIKMNKQIIED